jgi:hypothetical protein
LLQFDANYSGAYFPVCRIKRIGYWTDLHEPKKDSDGFLIKLQGPYASQPSFSCHGAHYIT